uniref:tyrosine-type recombinase/integrase n=1 Tax=Gluconobacter thailandicus TaxID=257438 RepID=UPI000776BAFF|nr:tyrosine-type recombinase/integrase [Gluconobacter thailandicus]
MYLRRPGHKRIALPDERDPAFFQKYQQALASTEQAAPKPPRPQTLASLIDIWMEKAPAFQQLSEASQVTYRRILLHMQKEDYADFLVSEFKTRNVRRFIERFADRPAAANHRLKMFRLLFEYAVNEDWRPDNPASAVKRLREKAEGAASWTDEQIEQFERRWPVGSVPRLALALLIYTGQRRSDVVRMGWKHVRGDLIEVKQQKTGAVLLIPIHPLLQVEIEAANDGAETFLQRQDGIPFTANGFYMRFKSWREEAGLPDGLSPHGLRKAAARRLAEAGCSAHEIASITGHATLAEVQRYTRAVDQEKLAREAMRRMENVKRNRDIVKPPE